MPPCPFLSSLQSSIPYPHYVLLCFFFHNPAILLSPIIVLLIQILTLFRTRNDHSDRYKKVNCSFSSWHSFVRSFILANPLIKSSSLHKPVFPSLSDSFLAWSTLSNPFRSFPLSLDIILLHLFVSSHNRSRLQSLLTSRGKIREQIGIHNPNTEIHSKTRTTNSILWLFSPNASGYLLTIKWYWFSYLIVRKMARKDAEAIGAL